MSTPPVIAVVGNSNSGKTRVAASLIEALVSEGYCVAAIKHCPHGHEADRSGSDTDRLFKAGAAIAIASSPGKLTTVERVGGDPSLQSVVASLGSGIDLVVAEGFKTSDVPKILVVHDNSPPQYVENVIAIVSDAPLECEFPTYSFEVIEMLACQLRRKFLEPHPATTAFSRKDRTLS